MPEIYQKMVLKWNVESYGSPTNTAQQGIFFKIFILFFELPATILRSYECMELRGGGRSGLTLWQCLLWERPDHLPGQVCMFMCMCVQGHAWKKEKICCPCDPSHHLLCVYLCVLKHISNRYHETVKGWRCSFMEQHAFSCLTTNAAA